MAELPSLKRISCGVAVHAILDQIQPISPDLNLSAYVISLLGSGAFSAISESILKEIASDQPDKLTDRILHNVCPVYVRVLDLSSCTKLTENGLAQTVNTCSHLHSLVLNKLRLTEQQWLMFFDEIRGISDRLTSLSLEGNDNLGDKNVQMVLKVFRKLKHLNISCCSELTDRAFLIDEEYQFTVDAHTTSCWDGQQVCSLTSVDVSGCSGLSSTAVRYLTALCGSSLRNVNISYSSIDSTSLWYLSGYSLVSAIRMVDSLAKTLGHDVIGEPGDARSRVLDELVDATEELTRLVNKQRVCEEPRAAEAETDDRPDDAVATSCRHIMTHVLQKPECADSLVTALNKHENKTELTTKKTSEAGASLTPSAVLHYRPDTETDSTSHSASLTASLISSGADQAPQYRVDPVLVKNEISSQRHVYAPQPKLLSARANNKDDASGCGSIEADVSGDANIEGDVSEDANIEADVSGDAKIEADVSGDANIEADISGDANIIDDASDEELEGAVGGYDPSMVSPTSYCRTLGPDSEMLECCDVMSSSSDDSLIIDVIAAINEPMREETESHDMSMDDDAAAIDAIAMSNQAPKYACSPAGDCDVIAVTDDVDEDDDDDLVIDAIAFSNQPPVPDLYDLQSPALDHCDSQTPALDLCDIQPCLGYTEILETSEISSLSEDSNKQLTFDLLAQATTRSNAEIPVDMVMVKEQTFSLLRDMSINSVRGRGSVRTESDERMAAICEDVVNESELETDSLSASSKKAVLDDDLEAAVNQRAVFDDDLRATVNQKAVLDDDLGEAVNQKGKLKDDSGTADAEQEELEADPDIATVKQVDELEADEIKTAELVELEIYPGTATAEQAELEADPGTTTAEKAELEADFGTANVEKVELEIEPGIAAAEQAPLEADQRTAATKAELEADAEQSERDCDTNILSPQEASHNDCSVVTDCSKQCRNTFLDDAKDSTTFSASETLQTSAQEDKHSRFLHRFDTPYFKSDSVRMVSHAMDFGADLQDLKTASQCDDDESSSSDSDVILSWPQAKFNDYLVVLEVDGNHQETDADACRCEGQSGSVTNQGAVQSISDTCVHCLNDDKLNGAVKSGTNTMRCDSCGGSSYQIDQPTVSPPSIVCAAEASSVSTTDPVGCSNKSETSDQKSSSKPVVESVQLFKPCLTSIDLSSLVDISKDLYKACVKTLCLSNGELRHMSMSGVNVDDELLAFIADHEPHLEKVALVECERLTNMGVAYLCEKCPKLTSLCLYGVCFITDFALTPLMNGRDVTDLNLAETNITDRSLIAFAAHLPQLRCLNLSWCEELMAEDADAMETFISAASGLEHLKLRHLPVSEGCLHQLAIHCLNLRVLNLSNVNMGDSQLISIALRCRLLEDLDVSWNSALTDASCSVVMRHLLHIRHLEMSGIKQLTSQPFLPIIAELPRWRKCQALLKFKREERKVLREEGEEEEFSDEDYECLYLPCRSSVYAPDLRSLELQYSDKVNDHHLAELVAVCRGTLRIKDYYGDWVTPVMFPKHR